MYLQRLALSDFRSYDELELELDAGVTVIVGSNGLGKTNIVEALGYVSGLSSHRVSQDAPLIRVGAEQAIIRAGLVRGSQQLNLEVEINASKANRARINRANPVRARNILGLARTVLFAPEDLALVKGDPGNRRRFLDELLQSLHPPYAAARADYDRALKQRNALLKSAKQQGWGRRREAGPEFESTLAVWDAQLARFAAQILVSRLRLVRQLSSPVNTAYAQLTDGSKTVFLRYASNLDGHEEGDTESSQNLNAPSLSSPPLLTEENLDSELSEDAFETRFLEAFATVRTREIERGMTLIGPHRDDLLIDLGGTPAKGYASHGETWSVALALRLGSYEIFLQDAPATGLDPILILDDVFAELDSARREKLAHMVADAEQVLVTAAVAEDIPQSLQGRRIKVTGLGVVERLSADENAIGEL